MVSVQIFYLLFIMLVNSVCSMERTLQSWVNPGCGALCKDKNATTVYLKADGPNDTLHYLWDFVGNPSVLLALTSPSGQLNINWEDFLVRKEKSVIFTEDPIYVFGIMVKKIIEFDDVNDTALMNTANVTNINVLYPEYFRWVRKTMSQNVQFVDLDMEGNCYNDTAKNISRYGSIKFSLRGFCSLDHSDAIPHMLHTENSTQIDIVLDHVQTNETFSNSRFAIELLVVGGGNPNVTMSLDPKKTYDDEHTPSIFEVIEVKTPPYQESDTAQNAGAYLQWRPVSYMTASRDVTSSTETAQYPPEKIRNRTRAIQNSMLYCYYGEDVNDLLVQKIVISLGSKGDGFYKKTHYSTWTFIIGYGTPPDEQFSYLVIMIISIGIGLPLIIMLITGLYICIRRIPKRRNDVYLHR